MILTLSLLVSYHTLLFLAQDVKFRRTAECDKPRVVWYVEHRSWLSPQATSTLLQHLSQCALWPCEVGRVGMVGGGGKGKGKEEEQVLSYHAVSYINLAPMLYPGGMCVSVCLSLP